MPTWTLWVASSKPFSAYVVGVFSFPQGAALQDSGTAFGDSFEEMPEARTTLWRLGAGAVFQVIRPRRSLLQVKGAQLTLAA